MSRPVLPILVITGHYSDFEFWCRENDISRNSCLVRRVRDAEDLHGYRGNPYVITALGWERRDIAKICYHLRYIEAVELQINDVSDTLKGMQC